MSLERAIWRPKCSASDDSMTVRLRILICSCSRDLTLARHVELAQTNEELSSSVFHVAADALGTRTEALRTSLLASPLATTALRMSPAARSSGRPLNRRDLSTP